MEWFKGVILRENSMLQGRRPNSKCVIFGLLWYLGAALVVALWVPHKKMDTSIGLEPAAAASDQINAFRFIRRDPLQKDRPSLVFSFDSLTTESGDWGIFKTSLQRAVQIHGLRIDTFGQEPDTPSLESPSVFKQGVNNKIQDVIQFLYGKYADSDLQFTPNVDFGNIAKITVRGFQFRRYAQDQLTLNINSSIAEATNDLSGLLLRGFVVIEAGNGSTLKCGRVIWDIQNQTLNVASA